MIEQRPVQQDIPLHLRSDRDKAQAVLNEVSVKFAVPAEAIRSKSRKSKVCEARFAAAYLMSELAEIPQKGVGLYLGRRDHSTIIHSLRRARSLLEEKPYFKTIVEDITQRICPEEIASNNQELDFGEKFANEHPFSRAAWRFFEDLPHLRPTERGAIFEYYLRLSELTQDVVPTEWPIHAFFADPDIVDLKNEVLDSAFVTETRRDMILQKLRFVDYVNFLGLSLAQKQKSPQN